MEDSNQHNNCLTKGMGKKLTETVLIPFVDEVVPELRGNFQRLAEALEQGQAAIEELALLKPTLALAISKLPKSQIKVDQHAELGAWKLEAKSESNGAIVLRAVKV